MKLSETSPPRDSLRDGIDSSGLPAPFSSSIVEDAEGVYKYDFHPVLAQVREKTQD
jgi:hypothetical protein